MSVGLVRYLWLTRSSKSIYTAMLHEISQNRSWITLSFTRAGGPQWQWLCQAAVWREAAMMGSVVKPAWTIREEEQMVFRLIPAAICPPPQLPHRVMSWKEGILLTHAFSFLFTLIYILLFPALFSVSCISFHHHLICSRESPASQTQIECKPPIKGILGNVKHHKQFAVVSVSLVVCSPLH